MLLILSARNIHRIFVSCVSIYFDVIFNTLPQYFRATKTVLVRPKHFVDINFLIADIDSLILYYVHVNKYNHLKLLCQFRA